MTPKGFKIKELAGQIAKGRQDVDYHRTEVVEQSASGKKHKFKFTIRSNSYKFQCCASVSVWNENELKWNPVLKIPAEAMTTENELCYWPTDRPITVRQFQDDVDELRRVALSVVF